MKWLILFNIILIAFVMIIGTIAVFIYLKNIVRYYLNKNPTQNSGACTLEKTTKRNSNSKYGYWKTGTKNIQEANHNLYDLVLEKCEKSEKNEILDIGCGNGEQDFYFLDKIDGCNNSITGLDDSEDNIQRATKIRKLKDIPKTTVSFRLGNPKNLSKITRKKNYDTIISLESAYKYRFRNDFFSNVSETLQDNGRFIVTDVVMKNMNLMSCTTRILTRIAGEYLHIPPENQVDIEEWKKSISDNGLEIVEFQHLTNDTFRQYVKHAIMPNTPLNNIVLPVFEVLSKMIFSQFQPFDYVMAVCKKKNN